MRLTERGAGLIVSENLEANVARAQEALAVNGEGREEIDDVVNRFREQYYSFAKKKPEAARRAASTDRNSGG